MKKETIKKYFDQVLKGGLIGVGLSLGITFGVLSIYAANWAGVSTATTSTNLTASMWNTTMNTITGAVQTLENSMVALTGDQTISGIKTFSSSISGSITGNAATATTLATSRTINGVAFNGSANITLPTVNTTTDQTIAGTKTFSSPVEGQTPTLATHLATKSYVDLKDISIVRGVCDFSATAVSIAYCSCNAGGTVDTQNKNIGLTGYKIISGGCNLDGTVGALNSTMNIGDDTWHCQSENTTYNVESINIVCANF